MPDRLEENAYYPYGIDHQVKLIDNSKDYHKKVTFSWQYIRYKKFKHTFLMNSEPN
jgi:hypothetical protein